MRARSFALPLTVVSTVAVATTLLTPSSDALTMTYLEKGTELPSDGSVSYADSERDLWSPLRYGGGPVAQGTAIPTNVCRTVGSEDEAYLVLSNEADVYRMYYGADFYFSALPSLAAKDALVAAIRANLPGVDFAQVDGLAAQAKSDSDFSTLEDLVGWTSGGYESFEEVPRPNNATDLWSQENWATVKKVWDQATQANTLEYSQVELETALGGGLTHASEDFRRSDDLSYLEESWQDSYTSGDSTGTYETPAYVREFQESNADKDGGSVGDGFSDWWDSQVTPSDAVLKHKAAVEKAWNDAAAKFDKEMADFNARWKDFADYLNKEDAAAQAACLAGEDYATPASTQLPTNPKPYAPQSATDPTDSDTPSGKPTDTGNTVNNDTVKNGSNDLDGGAIAGIVIGSLAGLIAIIAGVLAAVNPALLASILPL